MPALTTAQFYYLFVMLALMALWGMVALRAVQAYQPELAYVRKSLVCSTVGRPVWRRAYDRWLF